MSEKGGIEHVKSFLAQMAEDFQWLETREDQLLTLRELGDELPPMDASLKTEDKQVPGCVSATHVALEMQDDGRVKFHADSESFITRGHLYILTEAINGCTPAELLTEAEGYVTDFAEKSGMRMSMIASRANVFERVFHFMQKQVIDAQAETDESAADSN